MLPNKARGELAASDLGFIQLASIKLWLRGNESTPWLAGCWLLLMWWELTKRNRLPGAITLGIWRRSQNQK
jgi:hypothetical protein